ncbi:unnamed protein product [Thelazia callipaeda]|uniref:Uncharacterized protein n=1 Tax=Thelazia callipaeda TaxID=103827 RepID=A0A0N5CRS3_THECL|nr:unnamed protein product [Thelazia callipaeda]
MLADVHISSSAFFINRTPLHRWTTSAGLMSICQYVWFTMFSTVFTATTLW